MITGTSPSTNLPHPVLLAHAGLDSLLARRRIAHCRFCRRLLADRLPAHLQDVFADWLPAPSTHAMSRRSTSIRLPRPKKTISERSPLYSSFVIWNSLPSKIQENPTLSDIISHFT